MSFNLFSSFKPMPYTELSQQRQVLVKDALVTKFVLGLRQV